MRDKETLEQKRERLRQQEIRNNPTGKLNDSLNRAQNGNLVDLVGSLGWKGTAILILVIVLGFIIYSVFFAN
ncbi:DUF6366 family protein [Schinkia azotoformans]|uniref:Phage capsid protein n=1 Tax=Schinkia azotoformans LMG 9581 TaxID=1131731 RepID=K6BXU1_SCHAZ|nr:DUF6366 family protein [Schinkia azotoformans]EKN63745.1 hypothetical protein BAZO_16119 [Schinkia azotoformans LMG 9581]MEC1640958.1 DUF6366 family protein [Schinkia azotoformans]MEC1717987.1 DUF6366 family protein [Schinkia azotoformans]MEC1720052.1 DUF6366 family protein [Schinkia azotoformans]MEC1743306.1 DUF6366 family protein [Schinkia azotoformans]